MPGQGLPAIRKQLYVNIQERVAMIKECIFDCVYSKDDIDDVRETLEEMLSSYQQCIKALEQQHTKWGDVDKLAAISVEKDNAEKMVDKCLQALAVYAEDTLKMMTTMEASMSRLGLSTIYDDQNMTVKEKSESGATRDKEQDTEQEADYIREELEKLKARERELQDTLFQVAKDRTEDLKRRPEYSDFKFSEKTTAEDPARKSCRFAPGSVSTPDQRKEYDPGDRYDAEYDRYYMQQRYEHDTPTKFRVKTSPQVERKSKYEGLSPPQVEREKMYDKGITSPQVERRYPERLAQPQVENEPRYDIYGRDRLRYASMVDDVHVDRGASRHSGYETSLYSNQNAVGKHLTRIPLPEYDGNKAAFDGWWQAFMVCVDAEPIRPEVKLLRLRECVTGAAKDAIKDLGFSPTAYMVAKERLERKFGGERRKLTIRMEEVHDFKTVREGRAEDMERFAEMIDRLVVNLTDHGRGSELGSGMLYLQLKKKLPEELLRRYERWLFERRYIGDVASLREFANQEAEFQMHASETIRGFSTEKTRKKKDDTDKKTSRTLFGENQDKDKDKKYKTKKTLICRFCKREHGLWQCSAFKSLPHATKEKKIAEMGLCDRCLSAQHKRDRCFRKKPCTVTGCQGLHHTVLHKNEEKKEEEKKSGDTTTPPLNVNDNQTEPSSPASKPEENSTTSGVPGNNTFTKTMHTHGGENEDQDFFLGFRIIPIILQNSGREVRVNAILDDGSNRSYITNRVAHHLGIEGTYSPMSIEMIDKSVKKVNSMEAVCTLMDHERIIAKRFHAKTLDTVTSCIVPIQLNQATQRWPHLHGIRFPRPAGRQVEVLIGNDYLSLKKSIVDVDGENDSDPIARLTPLGWTCVTPVKTHSPCTFLTQVHPSGATIQDMLMKFWEIHEPKKTEATYTRDEAKAMDIAKKTLKYENKRYTIGIPWCESGPPTHDNNYVAAIRSMIALEKKLRKKGLLNQYNKVVHDYLLWKFIEILLIDCPDQLKGWFLTHFPVIREHVETTKVRMVNNGAGKSKGISLNDCILPGPKMQGSQTKILLRFRHRAIALSCDVEKMYMQILMYEDDQNYHCFVWRDGDESKKVTVYRFKRVVFGINASPFLAQYVCRVHAQKYTDKFPRAVDMILNSTFVDDGLDSVHRPKQGISLISEVKYIYGEASMGIHKWLSNSREVLESVPEDERAMKVDLTRNELPIVQSLGQGWNAEEDRVTFRAASVSGCNPTTKRSYLKVIATLYDPLGLAAPVTITGKIYMQELWLAGLDWDDPIPENIQRNIDTWIHSLEALVSYSINRCLVPDEDCTVYLHVFCDASNLAYGAVVYVWSCYPDGRIVSNIAQSKGKVAPIQSINTPRLELMAAIIGLRLGLEVAEALELPSSVIYFWTDSMDVLYWVRGHSRDFKPFVASRVGEIQLMSDPERWGYVKTTENPADMLSRGISSDQFMASSLWKEGPPFLRELPENWPKPKLIIPKKMSEQKKKLVATFHASLTQKTSPQHLVTRLEEIGVKAERYSTMKRYVKVVCFILRFKNKALKRVNYRGSIGAEEYEEAFVLLLKYSQSKSFHDEIQKIIQKKEISGKSPISMMLPWMDESGVLRGNTRLVTSITVPWETKYPILLGRYDPFSFLLVRDLHEKAHHAGPNSVLVHLRADYWIASPRELINRVEAECVVCIKAKAKPVTPQMAPLPSYRIDGFVRAFYHASVDFAGPFITKQGRGKVRLKRYLAVFTCLHVRAVHLEIVWDLSTPAFLLAFERMIARKGRPRKIWADNGSNFVGANNYVDALIAMMDPEVLKNNTMDKKITWVFNPPAAPHFSGVHEIMVKAAKKSIYSTLEGQDYDDEQLRTVACQVESLINSRPLTYQSSSEKDEPPLTPGHFIIGEMPVGVMPTSIEDVPDNLRDRWRAVQAMVTAVWKRWLVEWIAGLSPRVKWIKRDGDLKPGDLVLMLDKDLPRRMWPLGRVIDVFPGLDGIVRVVNVKVKGEIYKRPSVKLCPLRL